MGSAPSDYTFGSALGTQEINTRASFTVLEQEFQCLELTLTTIENDGYSCFRFKQRWLGYLLFRLQRRWAEEAYF